MVKARLNHAGFFFIAVPLLLAFFLTRIVALDVLPLHNDEGLHLTRAVEVWNGNPFWEIRDGKIINHWLIALFYPQNAPVFVGRIATIFVAMLGVAGTLAILRRHGRGAAVLGALLWIASPFMFFYDRMAFSDMQAGALGTLALWGVTSPLSRWKRDFQSGRGVPRPYTPSLYTERGLGGELRSLLIALPLALALLFKFTAAPFVLGVALLVLTRREPLSARLWALAIIAAVVAAAFAVPVAVLLARGSSLFDIALDWVGGGGTGGSGGLTLFENLGRLASLLWWGNPLHALMLVMGWAGALGWLFAPGERQMKNTTLPQRLAWMAAFVIPMTAILVLGRDAQSRHFAAAMPPLVALAGIGWGWMFSRIPASPNLFTLREKGDKWAPKAPLHEAQAEGLGVRVIEAVALAALIIPFIPFALNAYREPAALEMPPLMAWQYVEGYASGYGLREAVEAFPLTLEEPSLQVVGSMYGDSCRRANFYVRDGRAMLCGDAPMREAIEAALTRDGAVYVLVERGGEIGIDVTTVDGQAMLLAVYPRPHESEADASVRLWRVDR